MTRDNDKISKGGVRDPVARSIRSQNADRPSREEAKAAAQNKLSSEGCRECGEDDPDKLSFRLPEMPSCPAVQTPPNPEVVMCDDCWADRDSIRERALKNAQSRNDSDFGERVVGVVFYECESAAYVEAGLVTEDPAHGDIYADARPGWQPEAPVRCRCGADIDEYVALSEADLDE